MSERISVLRIPGAGETKRPDGSYGDVPVLRTQMGPVGKDWHGREVFVSVDVDLEDAKPYVAVIVVDDSTTSSEEGVGLDSAVGLDQVDDLVDDAIAQVRPCRRRGVARWFARKDLADRGPSRIVRGASEVQRRGQSPERSGGLERMSRTDGRPHAVGARLVRQRPEEARLPDPGLTVDHERRRAAGSDVEHDLPRKAELPLAPHEWLGRQAHHTPTVRAHLRPVRRPAPVRVSAGRA